MVRVMGLMLPRRVSAIGESNGTLPTGAHHDGSLPGRLPGVRPPALCVLRPRLVRNAQSLPRPAHPCHNHTVARPIAPARRGQPRIRLIGTRLLENEGFDVASAPDGETGIRLARTRRPEVVLLDVSLPGIDGFEVCRRIREFSDAYVIMVTGRTDESTA